MEKIISFHNPLKEDFKFKWDSCPYLVKAGETIQFPDFLARHGAKHLVDYIILHKDTWGELGIERANNNLTVGRDELYSKIFVEEKALPKVEKKTEKEKLKETVDELNKEPKEFEDLQTNQ